jgi:hypothetical protein
MSIRTAMTPANALASLALFLSLTGGAFATGVLPANSVGPKQLKKGAVTRPKLARGAVDSSKVKDGSLSPEDFGGDLPAGPPGPQGPVGPEGPMGPMSEPALDYESNAVSVPDTNTPTSLTVPCPAGQNVVSGGAFLQHPETGTGVGDSYPNGRTGWTADGINNSGTGAQQMTVYVICAAAGAVSP